MGFPQRPTLAWFKGPCVWVTLLEVLVTGTLTRSVSEGWTSASLTLRVSVPGVLPYFEPCPISTRANFDPRQIGAARANERRRIFASPNPCARGAKIPGWAYYRATSHGGRKLAGNLARLSRIGNNRMIGWRRAAELPQFLEQSAHVLPDSGERAVLRGPRRGLGGEGNSATTVMPTPTTPPHFYPCVARFPFRRWIPWHSHLNSC